MTSPLRPPKKKTTAKRMTEMSDIVNENEVIESEVTEGGMTEGEQSTEHSVVLEEALEAILFAAGHPVSYATLARVFEMTPAKVRDRVYEYSLKYNDPVIPRGVILLTYGESCQLCTKKYYLHEIREALGIKKSGTLSTSSLEALAIVAYNQPVTRAFVDTLRRADSSYAMNNLIDRGLIESKGRLDAPGRPMLYGTTHDFLRAFGIDSVDALPKTTEEMNAMFDKVRSESEAEEAQQEQISIDELASAEAAVEAETAEVAPAEAPAATDYEETSAEDDVINDDI